MFRFRETRIKCNKDFGEKIRINRNKDLKNKMEGSLEFNIYATSISSGEHVHMRTLARASPVRKA